MGKLAPALLCGILAACPGGGPTAAASVPSVIITQVDGDSTELGPPAASACYGDTCRASFRAVFAEAVCDIRTYVTWTNEKPWADIRLSLTSCEPALPEPEVWILEFGQFRFLQLDRRRTATLVFMVSLSSVWNDIVRRADDSVFVRVDAILPLQPWRALRTSMSGMVDVTIPVDAETADLLTDVRNRGAAGRLVSRMMGRNAGPTPLARALGEMQAAACATDLTGEEIHAALEANNAERRGPSTAE